MRGEPGSPNRKLLLPEQKGNSEAKAVGLEWGCNVTPPPPPPHPPYTAGGDHGAPESQRLPRALTRSPSNDVRPLWVAQPAAQPEKRNGSRIHSSHPPYSSRKTDSRESIKISQICSPRGRNKLPDPNAVEGGSQARKLKVKSSFAQKGFHNMANGAVGLPGSQGLWDQPWGKRP